MVAPKLGKTSSKASEAVRLGAPAGGWHCPGPVPTEFQARAGLYENPSPLLCRSAEQIAHDAYDAFTSGRRLIVPGIANKIAAALPRFLPRAVVLRAVEAFQNKAGPPLPKP